jgi:hypothetical protein
MDVIKKLSAGAPGTKRYVRKYGEQLVCVRYRRDKQRQRRLTTVEIVVDESPTLRVGRVVDDATAPHPNSLVRLRVAYDEENIRRKVKEAGGRWLPDKKLWELPYRKVLPLQLRHRIVTD